MTNAPIYARSGERFTRSAPSAPAAPLCLDVCEVPEQIERLVQAFELDSSEFADYLGLPTPTFREWRSGKSQPGQNGLQRIHCLVQIADEFQKAGVLRFGRMLQTPGYDGRTLLDYLKTGEDYSAHLLDLIGMAKRSQAAMERLSRAAANTPETDDWLSYISIPGGLEDE